MSYRPYAPPALLLIGYDPMRDLPEDHLARWVEQVVEQALPPVPQPPTKGQPAFDPRLCIKVLVYGYATGVRSSRGLERLCEESLPYLYLTRGDTPSYRTLCSVRGDCQEQIEAVWLTLLELAATGAGEPAGRERGAGGRAKGRGGSGKAEGFGRRFDRSERSDAAMGRGGQGGD